MQGVQRLGLGLSMVVCNMLYVCVLSVCGVEGWGRRVLGRVHKGSNRGSKAGVVTHSPRCAGVFSLCSLCKSRNLAHTAEDVLRPGRVQLWAVGVARCPATAGRAHPLQDTAEDAGPRVQLPRQLAVSGSLALTSTAAARAWRPALEQGVRPHGSRSAAGMPHLPQGMTHLWRRNKPRHCKASPQHWGRPR